MVAFLIGVSIYTFARMALTSARRVASAKFTLENVIQAAGVGVFLYVGYEWVTPLAEETTDYRLIGKGMLWAIGLLSITYCSFHRGHVRGPHAGAAAPRHADSAYSLRAEPLRRGGVLFFHRHEHPRIGHLLQLRAPQHLAVFLRHGEGQRPAQVLQQAPLRPTRRHG